MRNTTSKTPCFSVSSERKIENTFVPARKQPDVEEYVCLGIDGGVQPVALIVEVDHGSVDRDVIRLFPSSRL